jgi:hypothetical protein
MARATYQELSEMLEQQQAESQKLKGANELLSETLIKLIKILSDAVPQMETRHGRTVIEQVFHAHKRLQGKEGTKYALQ